LVIELNARPQSDTLFLETDNGDNPAIELRDFRSHYPVTRLVFKATLIPRSRFGFITAISMQPPRVTI
jgi:hypothetical protein